MKPKDRVALGGMWRKILEKLVGGDFGSLLRQEQLEQTTVAQALKGGRDCLGKTGARRKLFDAIVERVDLGDADVEVLENFNSWG